MNQTSRSFSADIVHALLMCPDVSAHIDRSCYGHAHHPRQPGAGRGTVVMKTCLVRERWDVDAGRPLGLTCAKEAVVNVHIDWPGHAARALPVGGGTSA